MDKIRKNINDKCLCLYCGKQFCNKSTLMKHEKLHTQNTIMAKKVKPIKVQQKQKRNPQKEYTSISSLIKHEKLHTENSINKKVKPIKQDRFQCEFCNYKSDRKSSIDM